MPKQVERVTKLTPLYSTIHTALREEASRCGVTGMASRIVLAVQERGGKASTADLYGDFGECGSQVRRHLPHLYAAGLATGSGVDGGLQRCGVHTLVSLTDAGLEMAENVRARVYSIGNPCSAAPDSSEGGRG